MSNKIRNSILGILGMLALNSCSSLPKGAAAVRNFDQKKYLGQWYEIARMDFRFERNMNNVTANYSINPNGTIRVLNKGFDYKKKVWKQAEGKAKFAGDPKLAMLKVSFFGPFYAAYNVIALDKDYKYALVAGKNLSYLWILSRETTIPVEIRESYLALAESIGYNTSALIWTEHSEKQ